MLVLAVVASSADAQTFERGPGPIATLHTWADGVWWTLLDPEGTWFGRLADEGLLQRFNPAQDAEYELDLRTALFSPADDARWAAAPTGFRAAAGSIDHPHIAHEAEWRQTFPIANGWAFEADYVRQRSLSAVRDLLRPGVSWRTPGGAWKLGTQLGVHFFKPSADLELEATRRWEGPDDGVVRLRVALLDAFSDLVFEGLGVAPEQADAHLSHRHRPLAARLDALWSPGPLRIELRGGASRRSRTRVTFPDTGDPPYQRAERLTFAGALVEWRITSRTALAARALHVRADMERHPESADGPRGLLVREVTRSAGVRARQSLRAALILEAEVERTERPEDRLTTPAEGAALPFHHRDREWFGAAALLRDPARGWTARLLWAALNRHAGELAPDLTAHNQRLVIDGGYRFTAGFEVSAGIRWDLDNLAVTPFDGAQLRVRGGAPR